LARSGASTTFFTTAAQKICKANPVTQGSETSRPLSIRDSRQPSLRWSDLEGDNADIDSLQEFWQFAPTPCDAPLRTARDPPFAWDAASATSANSDIPQQRRELGYCVSEPSRRTNRKKLPTHQDGPIKGRFNGRHHTKKEAQLPPKPLQAAFASQADTKVVETTEEAVPPPATNLKKKEIRSRHLQVVDRDHSPARFHHEDQRQALSKEMKESAQQVFDGWGSKKRMSTVMAAMEELPKRVGEDMHKMVSHVVDSVQTEINEVSAVIRDESDEKITGSTKVVRHLEVIPTMVVNLLESRVEKAKAEVRKKVGGMILQLSAIQETNENDEELAEQMQVMSSEVAQIAGAAVEAATQECRAHATQQLDIVLANLVENHQDGDEHKVDTRWRKVCEIRNAVEEDLLIQKPLAEGFPSVQSSAMENAVAVIKDKDFKPDSVTNEIVADQLLRAKVRSRGDVQPPGSVLSSGTEAVQMPAGAMVNPGSLGHPELCTRPCIYFRTGSCTSASKCGFCHMPHSRRTLRLDKRHRECLRRMPFKHVLKGLVPIIRTKILTITAPLVVLGSVCEAPAEEGPQAGEMTAGVQPQVMPAYSQLQPVPSCPDPAGWHTASGEKLMHQMAVLPSSTVEALDQMRREVLQLLEELSMDQMQACPGCEANPSSASRRQSGQSTSAASSTSSVSDAGHESYKAWFRGLSFMNLRSLLVMLQRIARDSGTETECELIQRILQRIRGGLGFEMPDFQEEEPLEAVGAAASEPVLETERLRVKLSKIITNQSQQEICKKLQGCHFESGKIHLQLSQLMFR